MNNIIIILYYITSIVNDIYLGNFIFFLFLTFKILTAVGYLLTDPIQKPRVIKDFDKFHFFKYYKNFKKTIFNKTTG